MKNIGNILVVDDTRENLRLLSDMLTGQGYLVRPVSNGPGAISSAQFSPPDLILLDILMPDMDGYEVCRRLKADERTRDIPVLFISALKETFEKVEAFTAGGVDYITKPFQEEEVLARVKTQLTLRKAQQHLQNRNRELSLLNRIGQMFSSSLDLDQVLETALQEIQRLLDVVSTSIWLFAPETEEIECRQIIGPGSEDLIGVRLPAGQGITGWVARHGESLIVADIFADSRHHQTAGKVEDSPARSMLSIPLKVKGDVIGVLNLTDPGIDRFTQEDLRFIEPIAAAAASAIENARLYTTAQQEIAERKLAEAALREANAGKDKFFSIISHDLRSPFTSLLGYTQLMHEQFGTYTQDKLKQHIEHVHTSAKRLYTLLENLLAWSQIQRGVMEYESQQLDLSKIAEDNVDLFLSKAEQKQITLTNSVPEGLEAYADYNMVNTVIRNLVSNALKFPEIDGSIGISGRDREDHVEIAVSDTGTGILPEDIPKLFRIDVQYTNTGTGGETGTGLGLNLCHDLVEKNGGEIRVESTLGQGTTFTFTLPKGMGKESPKNKDLSSRYISVNDKTLEAFGLSREEVIGKNDFEYDMIWALIQQTKISK